MDEILAFDFGIDNAGMINLCSSSCFGYRGTCKVRGALRILDYRYQLQRNAVRLAPIDDTHGAHRPCFSAAEGNALQHDG